VKASTSVGAGNYSEAVLAATNIGGLYDLFLIKKDKDIIILLVLIIFR